MLGGRAHVARGDGAAHILAARHQEPGVLRSALGGTRVEARSDGNTDDRRADHAEAAEWSPARVSRVQLRLTRRLEAAGLFPRKEANDDDGTPIATTG
jgi:hypothetical protein